MKKLPYQYGIHPHGQGCRDILGMGGVSHLKNDGNPYNGYINPYYWVDDHPLLYGNNGSLDPGTCITAIRFFIYLETNKQIPPSRSGCPDTAGGILRFSTCTYGQGSMERAKCP